MKRLNTFIYNRHSERSEESQKKRAFTLAEVLITLTIIGVIAALTIPNLMQKYENQVNITKIKKAYALIENSFQSKIKEEGCPDIECFLTNNNFTVSTAESNSTRTEAILKLFFKDVQQNNNYKCFPEYAYDENNNQFKISQSSKIGNKGISSYCVNNFGIGIWSGSFSKYYTNDCSSNGNECVFMIIYTGETKKAKLGKNIFSLTIKGDGTVNLPREQATKENVQTYFQFLVPYLIKTGWTIDY